MLRNCIIKMKNGVYETKRTELETQLNYLVKADWG